MRTSVPMAAGREKLQGWVLAGWRIVAVACREGKEAMLWKLPIAEFYYQ
jgi:hypothetical protein